MKKLFLLSILSFIVMIGFAQAPSDCAPGESAANEFRGFGFQVDGTFNFVQLKATEMTNFHVAIMPGYHFSNYFFAGIGAEYAYYNTFNLIPVFAHGTINFSKGKIIPFIQAKVGYTFGGQKDNVDLNLLNDLGTHATPNYSSDVKGSLYVAPAFGVKFRAGERAKIYVAAVADLMVFKFAQPTAPDTYGHIKNASMGLKVGFEF